MAAERFRICFVHPVAPPPGRGLSALIPGAGPLAAPQLPSGFAAFIDSVHQLNLTALAGAMNVTKATMSERIKKLARQGMLRKSKALD
ncbi:MAG: MarR family transcriptional regulator, partial [Acidimicrobiales bacterium]